MGPTPIVITPGPPGRRTTPAPECESKIYYECMDNSFDITLPGSFPGGKKCFVHFPHKPVFVSQPGRAINIPYKICCSSTCGMLSFFSNLFAYFNSNFH